MQKKLYQITDKLNSRKIAEFLSKDGQLLLPFLELICNTEQAVDELIDVVGKAAVESVLLLSARQIAGPYLTFHGHQSSQAKLQATSDGTAGSPVSYRFLNGGYAWKSPGSERKAKVPAKK